MHSKKIELIGRNEELGLLEKYFDNIIEGHFEVVLLNGLSGTGKTSLIQNSFSNLTKDRGYFITGKFDKNSANEPYKPLIQAFSHIIHYFLSESNKKIEEVKTLLFSILGTNSSMISTLIPEIELIIGPQEKIQNFDIEKVRLRFERVFIKFIQVFATKDNPLVLFMDDLQWIDEATLELLKIILTSQKNKYLLVVGTYRDEEVDENHLLMSLYDDVKHTDLTIRDMSISNLTLVDTYHIVKQHYNCSDVDAKLISKEIYLKTFGNPFYTKQMLSIIEQEYSVTHNSLEIDNILSYIKMIEQNQSILDIVFEKIRSKSNHLMPMIKRLACLGWTFSLKHFYITDNCAQLEGAIRLKELVSKNIILPVDDKGMIINIEEYENLIEMNKLQGIEFEFIHDNIYSTAFNLLSNDEIKTTYLDLGRKLVAHLSKTEIEYSIYKIITYFNYDSLQIIDDKERLNCARLNYQAGLKAKSTSALILAESTFEKALLFLPNNHNRFEFDINYELYQCLFINSKYEDAKRCVNKLFDSAENDIDRSKICSLRTVLYTLVSRYEDAINEGVKSLNYLDIPIQNKNYIIQLGKEVIKATWNFRNSRLPKLCNLPEVESEKMLLALKTLAHIAPCANLFNEDFFAIVILKLANIATKGNSKYSQVGYSSFAIVSRNIFGDFKKVKIIESMVLELCDKYNDEELLCLTYFILSAFVTHWNNHGNKSLEYAYRSYHSGLETGDLFFSGYAATQILEHKYVLGKPLLEINTDCTEYHKYALIIDFDIIIDLIFIISSMIKEFSIASFNDDLSHLFKIEKKLIEKDSNEIMTYYIILMQLYLLSGRLDKALEIGNKAYKKIKTIEGFLMYPELLFIYSLTITSNFETLSRVDQMKYQKILNKSQKQMKHFSSYSKENFHHKYMLVDAEMNRLKAKQINAMASYDQAISSATESGYTQNIAISNEFAAKYYRSVDRMNIAVIYINEAYKYYKLWGAHAKCNQLLSEWKDLIEFEEDHHDDQYPIIGSKDLSSPKEDNKPLHIEQLMGIYNNISAYAITCDYFQALLKGIIELTSASKGAIMLEEKSELFIKEYFDSANGYLRMHDALEDKINLPKRIIRYVGRTNEAVLFQNNLDKTIFMKDVYIREAQPINLICMPFIYKGISIGVIYLEGHGDSNVFNETHCESIKLIIHKAIGDHKLDHLVIDDFKDVIPSNSETVKLSTREQEVLTLLAEGKSNKDIADELFVTVHTIKTHLINIYNKLEVNSRIQAVIKATKVGLIS